MELVTHLFLLARNLVYTRSSVIILPVSFEIVGHSVS